MGWLWIIPSALLVIAGWLTLALYAEHLARQGRYDRALKLVPVLATTGIGRNRLRAGLLISAGKYQQAERILRPIVNDVIGKRVPTLMRVKTCFDLEDLGNVLLETDRFEEALWCFRDAANKYPYHSVWAIGMAEVFLRQGVFPKVALGHVETALKLFQHGQERFTSSNQVGIILATKAWALAALDQGAESRQAIETALNSPARKTKGPFAQVHFKAGMSFLALSDARRAEHHFASGTKLDPAGRWGRHCADALHNLKQVM